MSSKPFDVSVKDLIEDDSRSWADLAEGVAPARRTTVIDADVSTVLAVADKVIRVESDEGNWLMNVEPEARHAADAPGRLRLYSAVLTQRHRLPVKSVLLLLRREANASNLTERLELFLPGAVEPYDVFRYQVIRLWQQPLARYLAGGLGILPLAPLTDEAATNLVGVVRQVEERLSKEAPPGLAAKARTATFVLLGLRYEQETVQQVFREVTQMEESSTYRWIVSQGELREARKLVLRAGKLKFGQPADPAATATIEGTTQLERLETLMDRVFLVSSWQELLATP